MTSPNHRKNARGALTDGRDLRPCSLVDAQSPRKPPRPRPRLLVCRRRTRCNDRPPPIRLPRQISRPEEHMLPLLVFPQLPLPVQAQESLPAVTRHHRCFVRIHHRLVLRRQHVLEVRDELLADLCSAQEGAELLPFRAASAPLGAQFFACHWPPSWLLVGK